MKPGDKMYDERAEALGCNLFTVVMGYTTDPGTQLPRWDQASDDVQDKWIMAARTFLAEPGVGALLNAGRALGVLGKLLAAARAEFRDDPTAASVCIAQLPDGTFYAALHRYREAYAKARLVVCKVNTPTLVEALKELALVWLGPVDPEQAKRDLREALKAR